MLVFLEVGNGMKLKNDAEYRVPLGLDQAFFLNVDPSLLASFERGKKKLEFFQPSVFL